MKKALFFIGLLASSSYVYAADAIRGVESAPSAPTNSPPASESSEVNWGGFYGGATGGVSFSRFKDTNGANQLIRGNTNYVYNGPGNLNLTGPNIGGFMGFNFQQDNIVYGVEGDIGYAFRNKKSSSSYTPDDSSPVININEKLRTELYGSVRGRLGYSIDNALVYATGGWVFAKVKSELNTDTGLSKTVKKTFNGPTIGAGVEYALNNNVFLRGEYRFNALRKKDNIKIQQHVVSVGVGVRF